MVSLELLGGSALAEESIEARVTRLEERERAAAAVRVDRDREIRDIKNTVHEMDGKLDELVAGKNRQDGAVGLGKWLVGLGFFGTVGSIVIATLHYIGLLKPPS